MFDGLKRKWGNAKVEARPQRSAVAHVVPPKPALNIKRITAGAFRPGMWVTVSDRVGILKEMNAFDVCTVMLTDADGFNLLEMQVPYSELRRARIGHIPRKRVDHLSNADLERMGYPK